MYRLYNEDCVEGCKKYIPDDSVDLIITDPPYGINGDTLHRHYNRKEDFVIDGYIEVPQKDYPEFTRTWVNQAARILKPGGSIYIVSGYTNLFHILAAMQDTSLREMNHIVWKYTFGVHTRNKYVSSHYHILFYVKPGQRHTFNTYCRYGEDEKIPGTNRSLNYDDREDVWIIPREYKRHRVKNKNQLPQELLIKMLQYSSNPRDLICDLFLGSFSTAKAAVEMGRQAIGFELSKPAYDHQMQEMKKIIPGRLLATLRTPGKKKLFNQGKPWTQGEKAKLFRRYTDLLVTYKTKARVIAELSSEFGRGYFSILNKLNTDHERKAL